MLAGDGEVRSAMRGKQARRGFEAVTAQTTTLLSIGSSIT